MKEVSSVGLDIPKKVFQVHGIDRAGEVTVRRALRRSQVLAWFAKLPRCLVGLEACATAHYWARELRQLGHEVRLIPPAYAKAYVRRNKNDPADAAAICEAPTAHLLDELALYGYRPGQDEPDPRPLPEPDAVQAHLDSAVEAVTAMLTGNPARG